MQMQNADTSIIICTTADDSNCAAFLLASWARGLLFVLHLRLRLRFVICDLRFGIFWHLHFAVAFACVYHSRNVQCVSVSQ